MNKATMAKRLINLAIEIRHKSDFINGPDVLGTSDDLSQYINQKMVVETASRLLSECGIFLPFCVKDES